MKKANNWQCTIFIRDKWAVCRARSFWSLSFQVLAVCVRNYLVLIPCFSMTLTVYSRVAFDATLVGMLTRVWQIRLQQVGFPELLSRYKIEDDTWLHIANNGDMILKAWSDRDQTAGEYFQNLQILKQSLS